ncbi:MAG: hypothetical protein FJ116_03965 [Deltaproteobacteria bacterium]|nr:hypothetical protein [Deltaproteobacteria bacterium]
MINLIIGNCRYIFRSRMIFLILIFSTLVHVAGLKFVNHLTVSIQGVISVLGPKQEMYAALFLQLFTGLSIATVYGIWMAPYAHRGERSILTHMIPISKYHFPLCYLFCCALLLAINIFVMVVSYVFVFGPTTLSSPEFSWTILAKTFVFELISFEVVMLGLAVSSLSFGQVATFFIGGCFLFVLQILGAIARLFSENTELTKVSSKGWLVWTYEKLPPVGDFIFDLKTLISEGKFNFEHVILWTVWMLFFVAVFRWKIRYPIQQRSTEA